MQNSEAPYNIITRNIVTGARALGVAYTNNTGRTMFVSISIRHLTPAAGEKAAVYGAVAAVNGGTVGIGAGIAGLIIYSVLDLTVMPGQTYEVVEQLTGAGSNILLTWIESY